MNNTDAIPTPVFLPVLEETEEKEDLLLDSLDARQYERESVQRARSVYWLM